MSTTSFDFVDGSHDGYRSITAPGIHRRAVLFMKPDYWLIRVSATTARVATSLANAIAGTAIAFTDAGTGTHTLRTMTPRYNNGVGCEAFFVTQTAPTGGCN